MLTRTSIDDVVHPKAQSSAPCAGVNNPLAADLEAVFKVDSMHDGQVDVNVDVLMAADALKPDFYYFYLLECYCTSHQCRGNQHSSSSSSNGGATTASDSDSVTDGLSSGDGSDDVVSPTRKPPGVSDAGAGIDSASSPAIYCTASISLTNAAGSHLSSDEVRMPDTTRALVIAWVVALSAWLANWMWHHATSNKLHDMLFLGPVAKFGAVLCDFYEVRRQESGGLVSTPLEHLSAFFTIVSTSWFFMFCLFGVHGWCIVRHTAPENYRMMVALPFVFLCTSIATEWVHSYFLALSIIAACVMVVNILRESGVHLHYLHVRLNEITAVLTEHHEDITQAQLDAMTEPLLSKRFLMEVIRVCFVGYALLWAFLGITKSYLKEHRWLEHMLNGIIWIVTWWFMMWVFRLRDRSRYRHANAGGGDDGGDGNGAEGGEADPKCSSIGVPGGQITCIGVAVSAEQYAEYLFVMQKSVKTTKAIPRTTSTNANANAGGGGENIGGAVGGGAALVNDPVAALRRRLAGVDVEDDLPR